MGDTVGDVLPARLRETGAEQVLGYPGDGINGLLAAWARAHDQPQFVPARHEQIAAFEAVGYAKFGGMSAATVAPDDGAVTRAAKLLNAGEKVALLAGQGARGCVDELTEVAELLGAGAAKVLLGSRTPPRSRPRPQRWPTPCSAVTRTPVGSSSRESGSRESSRRCRSTRPDTRTAERVVRCEEQA